MKIRLLCLVGMLLCGNGYSAEAVSAPAVLRLWSDTAPGSLGTGDNDIPTLTCYWPASEIRTDVAIVICPGGGYGHLAADHEGKQIAEWFNSIGVSAFVLRYRLPVNGYRHPVPLMDAQRAVRLVRSRAEQWQLNPAKIGIIGFSAGGHLASSAGTHFEKPVKTGDTPDAVDIVSCRPDYMVLVYPVISMQEGLTHSGSRNNLLGKEPSAELVELMSNEQQVTALTPPTFLVHANDDRAVLPENSVRFYLACRKADVPAELHLYLKGGHGFGMRPGAGPAAKWTESCEKWMQQLKILP
jgi:acetyl esterase/lipase